MTSDYDKSKVGPRPWGWVRNISKTFTIWAGKKAEYLGAVSNENDAAHIVKCVNEHDRLAELARIVEQAAFDEADPVEFTRVVIEAFFEFEPEAKRGPENPK